MRRYTAWLAMCTVLFAALLPTLSHAVRPMAAIDIAHLNGICTAMGYESPNAVDDGTSPGSGDDSAKLQHCPFCVKFGGNALPGHDTHAVTIRLVDGTTYPRLFFLAPRLAFVWASAQPRAPPISA